MDRMKAIQIFRTREQQSSIQEKRTFGSLAGTLLYLDRASLPQPCFIALNMQQNLGRLLVSDIIKAG